jgi:hypothetical protein
MVITSWVHDAGQAETVGVDAATRVVRLRCLDNTGVRDSAPRRLVRTSTPTRLVNSVSSSVELSRRWGLAPGNRRAGTAGACRSDRPWRRAPGRLPARWVIHTVGPVWSATEDRSPLLRRCYHNSLAVAGDLGAKSVAFPLISSGVYRWPKEDAIIQALTATRTSPPGIELVRLVLFDDDTRQTAERVRQALHGQPIPPGQKPEDL